MTKLKWDETGKRLYETGVNKGVLYEPDNSGVYGSGVAWNGLTMVTEAPSGAEPSPIYADNIKYLNLISTEEFGATVEAYTYPEEFGKYDGTAAPTAGVYVGQQSRRAFGLSYQTRIGNDIEGPDLGYKIHLIYNATAAPSEKGYMTINDSPEAITFSWELTTTPINAGETLKPTALLVIDSTKVDQDALATLEEALYGTTGTDPRLPLPEDVLAIFSGTITEVVPTEPAFDAATDTITIPSIAGVVYKVDGDPVASGPLVITEDTFVTSSPDTGYKFPSNVDTDWGYDYTP